MDCGEDAHEHVANCSSNLEPLVKGNRPVHSSQQLLDICQLKRRREVITTELENMGRLNAALVLGEKGVEQLLREQGLGDVVLAFASAASAGTEAVAPSAQAGVAFDVAVAAATGSRAAAGGDGRIGGAPAAAATDTDADAETQLVPLGDDDSTGAASVVTSSIGDTGRAGTSPGGAGSSCADADADADTQLIPLESSLADGAGIGVGSVADSPSAWDADAGAPPGWVPYTGVASIYRDVPVSGGASSQSGFRRSVEQEREREQERWRGRERGVFRALFSTPGGGSIATISHGSSMASSAAATPSGSPASVCVDPSGALPFPRIPTQSRAFATLDALRQSSNIATGGTVSLGAKRRAPVTLFDTAQGVKRARPLAPVAHGPCDALGSFRHNKVEKRHVGTSAGCGFEMPSMDQFKSLISQMQQRERARTVGRRMGRNG